MNIRFTTRTFKEGRNFVAHAIDLDDSSCGGTRENALESVKKAVTLFLGEAEKMGTLSQILGESGYSRSGRQVRSRECFRVRRVSLPDLLAHDKS